MAVPGDLADSYTANGFYAPIDALSGADAAAVLARLDSVTVEQTARCRHPWLYKCYLLATWANDLVRHPRVLDSVEAVLGPDILVISADIWVKPPGEGKHVSWHQDAQYYEIEPMAVVNAWVALTEATEENGCLRFSPGSHLRGLMRHANRPSVDNMLSHGQTLDPPVDEARAVTAALRPGQVSFHHAFTAHASGPNRTSGRRVGIAMKYMPADARSTGGPPLSAMLVRGRDHGTVRLERPPRADFDVAAVAEHEAAMAPHAATRYMHF
jgi:ectoine hydroxylase-related dioxygenase (phytanoyl-CoA dioxygenase family)